MSDTVVGTLSLHYTYYCVSNQYLQQIRHTVITNIRYVVTENVVAIRKNVILNLYSFTLVVLSGQVRVL